MTFSHKYRARGVTVMSARATLKGGYRIGPKPFVASITAKVGRTHDVCGCPFLWRRDHVRKRFGAIFLITPEVTLITVLSTGILRIEAGSFVVCIENRLRDPRRGAMT